METLGVLIILAVFTLLAFVYFRWTRFGDDHALYCGAVACTGLGLGAAVSLFDSYTVVTTLLKRVEILRPLPFRTPQLLFFSFVPQLPVVARFCFYVLMTLLIFAPGPFLTICAVVIIGLSFVSILTFIFLLAWLIFPGTSDYTHNLVRPLIAYFLILLSIIPGSTTMGILLALHAPLWLVVPFLTAVNIGICPALFFPAVPLYENYIATD
jgi:hypothetical protein